METKTEVNSNGFDIERKASKDWQKIAFVRGAGNSNSPIKYSYIDERPLMSAGFSTD